ncbi:MAG: sigma-54-dependent transcriptional regulator [Pseudohongiellaceae bacterium]
MHHILIVENDSEIRKALRRLLERQGFGVTEAASVESAATHDLDAFGCIIADLRLDGCPGTHLIRMTHTPVLILTNYASMRSAIDSRAIGAVNYLSLPLDPEEVLGAINRIISEDIKAQNAVMANPRDSEKPVTGMVGHCPAMCELFRRIRKVAMTNSPVMIMGESGTGKELVARAVHEGSTRQDASLISVNCAAIPENLIESELFGHEKDAFPGATSTRTGLVEEANNGTLFLDEIGELPLEAQARLLRVLQEHEIRKVGSVQSQKVDIRLVAATHRDLKQLVNEGRFREDLYYRINVMPLEIPPLRARGADVLELADRKLEVYCNRLNVPRKKFSPDAIQGITTYHWPGNVRELENAIERAVILTEENEIPLDLMGLDVELVKIDAVATATPAASNDPDHAVVNDKDLSLKDYFQRFVLENQDELNETELAKKLGISRKCLWERRQRFNIPRNKKKPA